MILYRHLNLTLATLCATAWMLGSTWAGETRKSVQATATIGMVADLVKQVGGGRVEVSQLMGPGVDPHLYKATTTDAAKLAKSDVIFYSGLMLEGRMGDLFARLARNGKKVYAITESVDEKQLLEPAEFEGHYDPHLWFDVSLWAQTVPTITKGLCEVDPDGAAVYEKNSAKVLVELAKLDEWCKEKVSELPAGKRVLVTSHDAYNYFGRAYGFKVIGLQGVSTVSEASLADVTSLVDLIKKQGVKAIFVETSVNPAAIKRVAEDAGVKVGGEIFSDAMGEPGEMHEGFDTGTYEGMIKYNLATIVNALK
jgi:manganese/zinc/iron transport system substrate-binding protein